MARTQHEARGLGRVRGERRSRPSEALAAGAAGRLPSPARSIEPRAMRPWRCSPQCRRQRRRESHARARIPDPFDQHQRGAVVRAPDAPRREPCAKRPTRRRPRLVPAPEPPHAEGAQSDHATNNAWRPSTPLVTTSRRGVHAARRFSRTRLSRRRWICASSSMTVLTLMPMQACHFVRVEAFAE